MPCVGVPSLSGLIGSEDIAAHLAPGKPHAPLLMVIAEDDIDCLREFAPPMVQAIRGHGFDVRLIGVPGRDHRHTARAIPDTGVTVQQVMRAVLRDWTDA